MAGKFVDLKEAAKILGVTAEELVDMRSRSEIFGYRDGASWKFKIEEVERVASERSAAGKSGSGVLAGSDDDFGDFLAGDSGKSGSKSGVVEEGSESVLINEEALGGSAVGKQSTIIGKAGRGKSSEDSDLKLAGSDDSLAGSRPAASLSGISPQASQSDLHLGGSDVKKGSDVSKSGSGKSDDDVLSDVQLARPGSGTGVLGGDSGKSSNLGLAESGSYDLSDESISLEGSSPNAADEDSISLDASDLKQGPGTGSDVTYSPNDSGINLRTPSDSGLSLDEEPLDLGGSGVDQLELPEDDDVIALEEEADSDSATQLKADEAFSLSPAALDGGPDEESDSGSQVIALEDSSAFDQGAATMLNQGGPLLEEGAFSEMPEFGTAPGMTPMTGMGPQVYVAPAPVEAPYSVWNVLGLMATAGVLALSGMLMWDVMLNLWSFNESATVSTSLMDTVISAVGLNK